MSDTGFATFTRAREAAGLTLEDAARQLRFAPRQLEALEAGQLQRLPGATIVRGMVRSYARLLRIDPEPLLAQIAAQMPAPDAGRLAQRYSQPVPFSDGARRSNLVYVALSLVLLVAVAAVALQWRHERAGTRALAFVSPGQMPAEPARVEPAGAPAAPADAPPPSKPAAGKTIAGAPAAAKPAAAAPPASKAVASAPPVAKASAVAASAVTPPKPVAATPSEPAKPAVATPSEPSTAGTGRLALQFDGESWVEIRSGSGKLLVASLHTAGTERFVSGLPPFEVVIGNAQQVRLTYNDKPVDLSPYVKVEVARFTLQ